MRLNNVFVGFLWLGPNDTWLDKLFSKKARVRESRSRMIAKESGRGVKKGGKNCTEQCCEVERVKQRRWNNIEQCREAERARAPQRRQNTRKINSEDYRTSQVNSRDEINVQPYKGSHIIHEMIHKRTKRVSYGCLGKLQNSKHSGNRSFRLRVSSPTCEVDSPMSNVSSPTSKILTEKIWNVHIVMRVGDNNFQSKSPTANRLIIRLLTFS